MAQRIRASRVRGLRDAQISAVPALKCDAIRLRGGRIDNVKHAILCDGPGASSQNSSLEPVEIVLDQLGLWEFPLES
jgi:hypothetical protein